MVTPEGLPLAYEVLPGNTADNTTLRDFLARIERQYGNLPTERSGDMTDLTTTQMAGGLLDEFVRQYCAQLEQLR